MKHPLPVSDKADIGLPVIIISQNTAESEKEKSHSNEDAARRTDLVRQCLLSQLHSSGAPLNRMIKAVQVQINNVSVNTAKVCINPCFAG